MLGRGQRSFSSYFTCLFGLVIPVRYAQGGKQQQQQPLNTISSSISDNKLQKNPTLQSPLLCWLHWSPSGCELIWPGQNALTCSPVPAHPQTQASWRCTSLLGLVLVAKKTKKKKTKMKKKKKEQSAHISKHCNCNTRNALNTPGKIFLCNITSTLTF